MVTKLYFIIMQLLFIHSLALQESYKAAVLEFTSRDSGHNQSGFFANLREYLFYIEHAAAQNVQIIVFPEYGLTGWNTNEEDNENLSTEVPDPKEHISPCISQNKTYAKFLADISCAARRFKIYTVVNLIEKVIVENNTNIYHNTNVALDRNGTVIARFRKINLYEEPDYVSGKNELSTFTTDFGVKFGMFICFDIVFKTPSLDILKDQSVTDIVFSAAWLSELPFIEANSFHHGYAKANGVNLLAAALNYPEERVGGSGIYLANGEIAETYVSGNNVSKLIIQNVLIIKSRKDMSNACQGSSEFPTDPSIESNLNDISKFKTKITDLSNYTSISLNFDTNEKAEENLQISETVCSHQNEFCCNFKIKVEKHPITGPHYVYKLVAYNGATEVSPTKTIGLRNCGLVACLNDSITTCGGRDGRFQSELVFKRISVRAIFDLKNAHYQPSTLTFDQTPITDYMYCRKTNKEITEIQLLTAKQHDSLLTFGIVGRAYDYDDKPQGFVNCATLNRRHYLLGIVLQILYYFLKV